MKHEIKSGKIIVEKIFSDMWFQIPEYQRPYVWGEDEINDLLDDISYTMQEKPDAEYFLGSFVFQEKRAQYGDEITFSENDLLDGQQRVTTLLLIFSVIRDLVEKEQAKKVCSELIYREANPIRSIPERPRITFSIRQETQDFIDKIVRDRDSTLDDELLAQFGKKNDINIQNMVNAIKCIKDFLKDRNINLVLFLTFLLNKVLLIYVSTESFDDAFRLFTILNDRGVSLRNSDILKSINLGALKTEESKKKYAKFWEAMENELGEDFDRFLNHVRTILVKEKARHSLLKEFEEKIYKPKEKEQSTGKIKPPLLEKGEKTFKMIEEYFNIYQELFDSSADVRFYNLLKIMSTGLPSSDWIPPLLKYYEKYKTARLYDFLVALDNKFSADWIIQETPTARIDAMNTIIKVIEKSSKVDDVFSDCFNISLDDLKRVLEGEVYGKRFARYVLLKLDYFFQSPDQKMHFETLSVEHILPQEPKSDSQWVKDFTKEEKTKWTNKLGNLVIITRRKNASQGRLDYGEKKKRYFEKNIDTCPNSLRVLQKYNRWTPKELNENHVHIIELLEKHYCKKFD